MSEKRFTYTVDDRGFYTINDNVTGEKAVMVNDFLKWLNGLNDENEQLRQELIQEMKLHQETEEELQEYKSFMGLG